MNPPLSNLLRVGALFGLLLTLVVCGAEQPSQVTAMSAREEALAAKQKAGAAIAAAQKAIVAAEQASNPEIARKARALLEANQKKLAEAEALLRALPAPPAGPDPMSDATFVAAVFENAKKGLKAAEKNWSDALMASLFVDASGAPNKSEDEAWLQFQKAQQAFREIRSKKQTLEHPQLMADLKRLRQDPVLGPELERVLQRVHKQELDVLKEMDDSGHARLQMQLELKRLKDSGAFQDASDLLAKAHTDPKVSAAVQRAKESVMHDQADVLRDSTDEIAREVARLKQKLPENQR